jgi:hypothetical protein
VRLDEKIRFTIMSRILPSVVSYKEQKRKTRLFASLWFLLILVVLVFLAYLIIARSGHWLVQDDAYDHVSWVVILDGQSGDLERSDFARNLITEGKADSILILGDVFSEIKIMRIFMRKI